MDEWDIHHLAKADLQVLAGELRSFLIDSILASGGHFSANLGVVELTVALHHLLDLKTDRLIWDVGHQAYAHKVLTGRYEALKNIRKKGGISGFQKREESEFDHFGAGHSSTSISAILGMAEASLIQQNIDQKHVAVIGDGSLSAGLAFEGLNNLAVSNANVLVIINDNRMGIDPIKGGIDNALASGRAQDWFHALELPYAGPIDGHDLSLVINSVKALLRKKGPQVLHINTVKGKGYEPAEKEQTKWHAVKYVKIDAHEKVANNLSFPEVAGKAILEVMRKHPDTVTITPAMPSGSKLIQAQKEFPKRFFDVGIAEQHALTFAAGIATQNLTPICVVYSTFLQRAYDQVVHDVCLQNLPVLCCIDRGGVVGEDGATHHGIYDLSFLKNLPNALVINPVNKTELSFFIQKYSQNLNQPTFIRYPKSEAYSDATDKVHQGLSIRCNGNNSAVVAIGHMAPLVEDVCRTLGVTLFQMNQVSPLPDLSNLNQYTIIVTVEDGSKEGGIGQSIGELFHQKEVHHLGYPSEVLPHGTISEIMEEYGLIGKSFKERLLHLLPK
jgi:1-deoxy-D-xylulose-5-phosphate synthase